MKPIDHYLKEKIKKIIGLMKEELGGKAMTKFAALGPKTYSKKCVIKKYLNSIIIKIAY